LIAFEKSGRGSPLVLVHGTSADHTRWAPVLRPLQDRFTVYAVDRRGRGGSGDSDHYAIEREFEDIAAVVNLIGEPVNLLGYSYGAICSLEAATRSKNLCRLILYEPPIPIQTGGEVYPPRVLGAMRELLAKGDRDGTVAMFMKEIPRVPPHELELLRAVPAWQGRVAAAHTIPREMDASNGGYQFDRARFARLTTATLLLLGGDSPSFLKAATHSLHEILPNNRLVVMPGQQHTAMNTAPNLFVGAVFDFLAEQDCSIPSRET
jgi:pimeloyl-ACP methyl ester carboxylesterase